jgi:glycosyltransferase involved in cell wall biosynthesis
VRILHAIAELTPGGAERIVLALAGDAVAHGDAVAVASSGGPWVAELEAAGGRHYEVALPRRRPHTAALAAAQLRRAFARFRPDVVHAHNVGMAVAVAAARLAVRPRPPLVTTLHGVDPADLPSATRLLRATRAPVVACAPAVASDLRRAGFPAGRLRVVVNGARLEPASPERVAALADRLGLDGDRPLVVGVGRLVAQKRWEDLVEVAARLDGVAAVVAGEGPLGPDLRAMAERRGSPVRFVGPVDDVPALFGLAACLVSTSNWEGLPLVLLEALSLGVPVAAYGLDGFAEVTGDGAVLVPPGDVDALTDAVGRLLADQALAAELGRRARRAAGRWTPERMLASYRALYRDLAAPRPSGTPGTTRPSGPGPAPG